MANCLTALVEMAEQEALTLTAIDLNNMEKIKLKLMKKSASIVIGSEKDQDCPMDTASRAIFKLMSELCCDTLKILKIIPTIGNQDLAMMGSFSALASLEIELQHASQMDLMPISQLKNLCFLGLNLPSYEYFHSEGEKLCELFSALPKLEMLSIFVFMPDKQTALRSQEDQLRSFTFRPPACLLDWMEKNLKLQKFEPMGSGVNIMLGRD